MTSSFRVALVLTAAGLLLASGAQTAPDADAVFTRARKVGKATRSIKASLVFTIKQGGKTGNLRGSVSLMRPNYGHIDLQGDGAMKAAGRQVYASTGKHVFAVAANEKKYVKVAARPKGDNLFPLLGALLTPVNGFFDPEMVVLTGKVNHVAQAKIGTRTYQVVRTTDAESPARRRFYFGPTGLLERIEYSDGEGAERKDVSVALESVVMKPALTSRQFAYTPPAGYQQREEATAKSTLLANGTLAPAFEAPGAFGGKYSLKQLLQGKKALLVTFWFHNCGPCRMELPHLAKQYPALKKRGIEIVAINTDDPVDVVRQYIREERITYPVAIATGDALGKLLSAYRVEGFPTAYLLDSTGKIRWSRAGYDPQGLDAALAAVGK